MGMVNLKISYVLWHYKTGMADLARAWKDILIFVINFFSLPHLFATLATPYRRLSEKGGSGFNPRELLSRLFVNTVMRIVGFVIRLVIITIGVFAVLIVLTLAPLLFIFWLAAPLLILVLFLFGIALTLFF